MMQCSHPMHSTVARRGAARHGTHDGKRMHTHVLIEHVRAGGKLDTGGVHQCARVYTQVGSVARSWLRAGSGSAAERNEAMSASAFSDGEASTLMGAAT